jgi:hypothetical protein
MHTLDRDESGAARFGYGIQALGAGGLFAISTIQLGRAYITRVAVANIMQSWMTPWTAMLSGIYLLGLIVVNRYSRSELERWMLGSTWGNKPKGWDKDEELLKLEVLINKPQITLSRVDVATARDSYLSQQRSWQLAITFPRHTVGQTIELSVTAGQTGLYVYEEPDAIDISQGQWNIEDGYATYTLAFTADAEQSITVKVGTPPQWAITELDKIVYQAIGSISGDLVATQIEEPLTGTLLQVKE